MLAWSATNNFSHLRYGKYDGELRAEIAKWAISNGCRPAAKKYDIAESTIRGFIKSYKDEAAMDGKGLDTIPRKKRGGYKLLPEEIDEKVVNLVKEMQNSGAAMSYNILVGIAKGIVCANDRTLLKENGGSIVFTMTWAQSLFKRIGYVKRKATTAKVPISPGFVKEIGFTFYQSLKTIVDTFDIPSDLTINLDQTPLPYCLISQYTMAKKGSKRVAIAGSADHRQITGTFSITLSGLFLPMQLIYQGKTDRCHPSYEFPEGFNVTHTPNHWSNEEKAKELLRKVIIPHVKETRKMLGLRCDKEWLLIADVFKGQWTDGVKQIVEESNGKMVPIPANMTHIFQPLDLTVNRSSKAFLRSHAQDWYSNEIRKQMEKGMAPHEIKVDVRISVLKPLHAAWVTKFYDHMRLNSDIVLNGWKQSGITEALSKKAEKEDPFQL